MENLSFIQKKAFQSIVYFMLHINETVISSISTELEPAADPE